MKWFKHDSNANNDAKLERVMIKYGLQGYGLYWYCLELIAANVDKDNITFELEHDAEVIAHRTGINYELIQEMMTYMVEQRLFESSEGTVTCLKLAKRLDDTNAKNPDMKKLVKKLQGQNNFNKINNSESLGVTPIKSGQTRVEETRLEQRESSNEPSLFPENLVLSKDWINSAIKINPNLNPPEIFDKFRAHHKSKGTKNADWHAAWDKWCMDEKIPSDSNADQIVDQRARGAM